MKAPMRLLGLAVSILALAGLAHGDVRKDGKDYVLTSSDWPLELRFPKGKWKIGIRRIEGAQTYVLFNDDQAGLTMSFYIEPASKCATSADCRELYWSNPGPMVRNPTGVAEFERAGFAVVRFELPIIPDVPVKQLNYSAHLVRDGYWVDLHLSRVFMSAGDERLLDQAVDAIRIQPRSP